MVELVPVLVLVAGLLDVAGLVVVLPEGVAVDGVVPLSVATASVTGGLLSGVAMTEVTGLPVSAGVAAPAAFRRE